MKVFAVASIPQGVTIEQIQQLLPKEVPATLKHYLDGKIEQFWFRENAGPIFLMSVESVEEAKAELDTLPLVEANDIRADASNDSDSVQTSAPGQVSGANFSAARRA
jgi:hypothetical protein